MLVMTGAASMASSRASADFAAKAWLLKQGHWQIEVLANLDQVPASGALIAVRWPEQPVGLRSDLLRRRDSAPYARAFSFNRTIIRLECAHICPRSPTTSRRFGLSPTGCKVKRGFGFPARAYAILP